METPDWSAIGKRLGLRDAEGFARRQIAPLLRDVVIEQPEKKGGYKNRLDLPMSVGFILFIALFMGLNWVLPDTFLGIVARFILFPVLFLGSLAGSLWLFRGRLVEAFTRGKTRFLARSKALTALGREVGLVYTPSPGGAPAGLKLLAKVPASPKALKEMAALLDDHGGMDAPLAVARRSGALAADERVIGKPATRDKYLADSAASVQLEDGFQGEAQGVPFSAFEWIEKVDEAPNIHHLCMVFSSPHRFHGLTQMRTCGIAWPSAPSEMDLQPVGLIASAFEDRFRLRASDQMEARLLFDPVVIERVIGLAHGEKARAVAFEDWLVIDVAGADRFAMVDLVTGAWNEASIARTMINIAEMLELADALAHAFKLRAEA